MTFIPNILSSNFGIIWPSVVSVSNKYILLLGVFTYKLLTLCGRLSNGALYNSDKARSGASPMKPFQLTPRTVYTSMALAWPLYQIYLVILTLFGRLWYQCLTNTSCSWAYSRTKCIYMYNIFPFTVSSMYVCIFVYRMLAVLLLGWTKMSNLFLGNVNVVMMNFRFAQLLINSAFIIASKSFPNGRRIPPCVSQDLYAMFIVMT